MQSTEGRALSASAFMDRSMRILKFAVVDMVFNPFSIAISLQHFISALSTCWANIIA
jgi:hypothetical protein